MTSSKRADLQGLRGLAIIAVLLFHFFPNSFPNGYIGVDQFFVLSGFLIAMLLSRSKLNFASIHHFYLRRIRRIVPTYYLVLLCTLVLLLLVFPQGFFKINIESGRKAIIFATNIGDMSLEKEYALKLKQADDLFTHTWSLGVEMQFYLLVPLIVFASQFSYLFLVLAGLSSFLYSVTSNDHVAFNSVFARLWQFTIGMYAHKVSATVDGRKLQNKGIYDINGSEESEKLVDDFDQDATELEQTTRPSSIQYIRLCLLLFIVTQMFWSHPINNVWLGISVTLATGLIVLDGAADFSGSLLSSRFLTTMGDISYSLYLIHWPAYVYMRTFERNIKENDPAHISLCAVTIIFCILLSSIVTWTLEKQTLRLSILHTLSLVTSLLLATVALNMAAPEINNYLSASTIELEKTVISTGSSNANSINTNITKAQAAILNKLWSSRDLTNLDFTQCQRRPGDIYEPPFGWCDLEVPHAGSASYPSLMLLGNSYSANILNVAFTGCKDHVRRMSQYYIPGCEVLQNSCTSDVTKQQIAAVRSQKPDILFIIDRHFHLMHSSNVSNIYGSLDNDDVYQLARNKLRPFEYMVPQRIYILNAMPQAMSQLNGYINDRLLGNTTIVNSHLLDEKVNYSLARRRLSRLIKDCPKCRLIDYMPSFEKNGEFMFFDEQSGLSYFTGGLHLTPLGLDRIRPIYSKICENL